MEEEYRDVSGFEGRYKVSNIGNVFSVKSGKVLCPRDNGKGYLGVQLWKNGECKQVYIHKLVCKEFIGLPPAGCNINHVDGDKSNNCVNNLEYVTFSENSLHAVDSGLNPSRGETHNMAVLTESDVYQIRQLLEDGLLQREIAEIYNVSASTIGSIKRRERWTHLP